MIDIVTRLPVEIWFQEKATASDMRFELDSLNLVKPQTLILLDRGFCHYQFWQQLIERIQLWGTWLFYAVLVDLGDAIADEVSLP